MPDRYGRYRVMVTGYITIDPEEYDPGPMGPLSEDAYLEWSTDLGLEDIDFTLAERDD